MELNTIEKFLLLALHSEKWRFKITPIHLQFGIAGAILLDLVLQQKLLLQNNHIQVNNTTNAKDSNYPIFDEIVETIVLSRREHKPKFWIQKLGRKSRKLKWVFLEGLEKKRIVRIKHVKFLWIPYRKCNLIDKNAQRELISGIRESLTYKKKKSEEDITIMGLVESCKMYRIIEPERSKRGSIKKELKTVLQESPISQVLKDTIKQIQLAITVATIASAASAGGR